MENLLRGIPLYVVIPVVTILTGLVSFIVLKALREGREISFWPPKIGPRASSEAAGDKKSAISVRDDGAGEMRKINWHNSKSIFWIGYDLRETIGALLNDESKEVILHCLGQVDQHAKALGFDSSTSDRRLTLSYFPIGYRPDIPTTTVKHETITTRVSRIVIEVQRSLTPTNRKELARQIREIVHLIDKLAEENQRELNPNSGLGG